MVSNTLADAAFGTDPGRWPLPRAEGAAQLWLRAVAAGGQGRYAAARSDIADLLRSAPPAPLASLALSTRASFLRQQGWHWLAHRWDGEALAIAGDTESRVDALLGLAADALGVGRLAASATLLERARTALGLATPAPAPPPRLAIRCEWVGAELAMVGGDGTTAVTHARRGVELAEQALPDLRRHRVKSDVVLAAALCSVGDIAGARKVADSALDETARLGLIPLRWALSCLLTEIGSASNSAGQIVDIRVESAAVVTARGGYWHRG